MKPSRILTVLLVSMFFYHQSAYAYIDPGTGSYFFQLLIGALLSAGFVVKLYWSKIKKRLSGLSKKNDGNGSDDAKP
jgi:hypothetical protein